MLLKSLTVLAAVMTVHAGMPADTVATINLDAVTVSARVANPQNSSLRITDISKEQILRNAPGRTYVELVRNVPGVYSTAETGSFGDAKINIRGFKQENISVLLNGIPISGLTSGSMFWNNWMGLADATSSIQVQKGIGNSMLSDNSVGGTINIITNQPGAEQTVDAGFYHTGYGTSSAFVGIGSGELRGGWNFSLLGSHNWGTSYVEATDLSTWSYQAVVTKQIGRRHSLNFTALGSPEQHMQRSQRLSFAEVEKYGVNYSKNWGWYTNPDGSVEKRTLSKNNYFKPYFTLTHSYDGRDGGLTGVRVVTSIYTALANGGGYYTESKGKRIASFMGEPGSINEGHIDWNAAYAFNRSGTPDEHGYAAQNIMSDYQAGHTQAGLKSSVIMDLSERLNIDAGLHYQLYKTWEREQITDLMGADYWYENSGSNPYKKVGDYIRTRNGRDQNYLTVYGIASYKAGAQMNTILTLGLSASGTALRRWDVFNYSEADKYSDWARRAGGSVKAGVIHKFSRNSSIYANAAVYSRAPYANVFFSSGNNAISRDLVNEKNYMGELGYRGIWDRFTLESTAYMAFWEDKSLMSAAYRSLDEDPTKYMVKGLDALHYGIEVDASYSITRGVRAAAYASLGQWKWKNDVSATIYDTYTMQAVQQIDIYTDGLHVGDAPQTQIGANIDANIWKGLSLSADWNYNDRIWADFDPVTRTKADDRSDSFRLPGYHLVNLGAAWTCRLRGNRSGMTGRDVRVRRSAGTLTVFVNVNNLTDARYIERSKDGAAHDAATFTGYWANGRNINFGLRLHL